ncbi:Yip1 family protein [Phocaeicola paurosaccharolyticus]|uniref:Yip1 family protein n=1 Tax=Phocaeicola paurosaccharolyticus TaxID=732242 RepID=UPI000469EFC5|nr:Yip1 family protein [Phocaeicola paurosaccharolyticus]
MNYKNLFNIVVALLSSPQKAWSKIKEEDSHNNAMSDFVYPMIGLCALSFFIGVLIQNNAEVDIVRDAMIGCCAVAISLFGGFFLASYLVDMLGQKFLKRGPQFELSSKFVGYSMSVIFVLHIISGIIKVKLLFWLLQIYVLFVAFEGARSLMNVEREKLTHYTLMASAIIIFSPELIGWIFNKLSEVLN